MKEKNSHSEADLLPIDLQKEEKQGLIVDRLSQIVAKLSPKKRENLPIDAEKQIIEYRALVSLLKRYRIILPAIHHPHTDLSQLAASNFLVIIDRLNTLGKEIVKQTAEEDRLPDGKSAVDTHFIVLQKQYKNLFYENNKRWNKERDNHTEDDIEATQLDLSYAAKALQERIDKFKKDYGEMLPSFVNDLEFMQAKMCERSGVKKDSSVAENKR